MIIRIDNINSKRLWNRMHDVWERSAFIHFTKVSVLLRAAWAHGPIGGYEHEHEHARKVCCLRTRAMPIVAFAWMVLTASHVPARKWESMRLLCSHQIFLHTPSMFTFQYGQHRWVAVWRFRKVHAPQPLQCRIDSAQSMFFKRKTWAQSLIYFRTVQSHLWFFIRTSSFVRLNVTYCCWIAPHIDVQKTIWKRALRPCDSHI